MKNLFTCCCLLISMQLSAQKWVVFDRSDATNAIFNESDPYSLVSILATNNDLLQDYVIDGIPSDVLKQLNRTEKEALLCFLGPESDIPLIDQDPTSPNFGYEMIEEDENGNLSYVYAPRDSLYLGLRNLDRISFTLQEGQSAGINNLKQIELYVEIDGEMVSMGVLDAGIMDMTLWSIPRFLDENETKALMAPKGLYSSIREEAIEGKKAYESNGDELGYGYYSTYLQFFPWNFLNLNFNPYSYDHEPPRGKYSDYFSIEPIEKCVPISLDLSQSVINYSISEEELESRFESVSKVSVQSNVPLIDGDPNSEGFGEPLYRVVDEIVGVYENIYPEPKTEYVFLDFEPVFLTSQRIRKNAEGNLELIPYSLLWLQEQAQGRPELIANMHLYTDEGLIPELSDQLEVLKPTAVSEIKQLQKLIACFQDKRYLVDLPLDRIPTTVKQNKKGNYALVKGEHLMTKYIFKEAPIELASNLFQTRLKERTELRSDRGKVLYQGGFDELFTFVNAPDSYALHKDSLWTVISVEKGQHFDWAELPNAHAQLFLDGPYAYCETEDKKFIVEKDGLKGAIGMDGVQKIEFKFSVLHDVYLIEYEPDFSTVERNCWLGFDDTAQEWLVLDEQFKQIAQKKGGTFLMSWGDVIVFDEGKTIGLLNPFDGNTRIEQLSITNNYRELLNGFSPICVIDPKGNYIVPPTGAEITRVEIDSLTFFMVTDEKGLKMINIDGEVVGDLPEHSHNFMGCIDSDIMFVRKDGKNGITRYNKSTRKLEVVHEAKYAYITCSQPGDAFLASTLNEAGKTLLLFPDGRVEEKK